MFSLFKKKDPFNFTENIVTVADLYAKALCDISSHFIELLELSPASITLRQKSFGWLFFVMFHVEYIENDIASIIISSIQRNMSNAKWSASEINKFFDSADIQYRHIVNNVNDGHEILDTIQYLFFEYKADAIYDIDCKIKATAAIDFSIKGFHEFHEKVSHDYS